MHVCSQVDYAISHLKKFLQTAQEKGLPKVEVITGAGYHSGEEGPKVKMAVVDMLEKMGVCFHAAQEGSFIVTF